MPVWLEPQQTGDLKTQLKSPNSSPDSMQIFLLFLRFSCTTHPHAHPHRLPHQARIRKNAFNCLESHIQIVLSVRVIQFRGHILTGRHSEAPHLLLFSHPWFFFSHPRHQPSFLLSPQEQRRLRLSLATVSHDCRFDFFFFPGCADVKSRGFWLHHKIKHSSAFLHSSEKDGAEDPGVTVSLSLASSWCQRAHELLFTSLLPLAAQTHSRGHQLIVAQGYLKLLKSVVKF